MRLITQIGILLNSIAVSNRKFHNLIIRIYRVRGVRVVIGEQFVLWMNDLVPWRTSCLSETMGSWEIVFLHPCGGDPFVKVVYD